MSTVQWRSKVSNCETYCLILFGTLTKTMSFGQRMLKVRLFSELKSYLTSYHPLSRVYKGWECRAYVIHKRANGMFIYEPTDDVVKVWTEGLYGLDKLKTAYKIIIRPKGVKGICKLLPPVFKRVSASVQWACVSVHGSPSFPFTISVHEYSRGTH